MDRSNNDHPPPPSAPSQPSTGHSLSPLRETLFVGTICGAQILTQAGLGQAIAPLHIIGSSLNVTAQADLSWFVAAYSLTVGTFILAAGRLGDLHGCKRMFCAGLVVAGLGAAGAGFAGFAKSAVLFDVFRAVQGAGAAGAMPNGLALLGSSYPPGPRKHFIFSLFGACAPGGFLLGALVASLFAQLAWWPWAFWSTAIACVFLVIAAELAIPSDRKITNEMLNDGQSSELTEICAGGTATDGKVTPEPIDAASQTPQTPATNRSQRGTFDLLGALLSVSGLILVNFAFNQGPNVGWGTPYVYATLIVGILLLAAFWIVEQRHATHPLLPPDVFNRETGFTLACIGCGWSSFGIWVLYTWEFMETVRFSTPLSGTAQFSPVGVSGTVAAITTGVLMSKMHTSWIMLASMTCFTVGTVLVATCPPDQVYWGNLFLSICIMPWGMDMSFPAGTALLSNSVPASRQGMAASLVNTVVNYSISIGLGIAGTVQRSVVSNRIAAGDSAEDVALKGFRSGWYTGIALALLGVLTSLFFVLHSRRN